MDGSHLADFLLKKDYKVFGLERRSSVKNRTNTLHLENKITFYTNSDTEVLIHGFKEWGMKGLLKKIDGDYAFAIWDDFFTILDDFLYISNDFESILADF